MTLFQTAAQMTGKPYNRKVAILGDSIEAHNTINGVVNWSSSNYGNRYISFGYMTWLRFMSGQAFDFDGNSNFGVVGDTSDMILARTDAALAASDAATWFLMLPINDRGSANLPLATSQANISAIVSKIINAGRVLVLMTPTASGDTATDPNTATANTGRRLSATQVKLNNACRRWMIDTFSSMPGVYVVDAYGAFVDPVSTVGDNLVGETYDGLHPSPSGARKLAQLLLPVCSSLFPPRPFLPTDISDVYDAVNNPAGVVNPNPMMTGSVALAGTQATGTGTIATSWFGTNGGDSGHGRVYSKVTTTVDVNGQKYPGGISKDWQQVVLSGTMGATADINVLYQNSFGSNLNVGDTIYGVMEIEVDDGMTNIDTLCLRIYNGTDFTIGGIDMHYSGKMLYMPTKAFGGIMKTPPILLPASTLTLTTIALTARALSGNAIAGTIRARCGALRKAV